MNDIKIKKQIKTLDDLEEIENRSEILSLDLDKFDSSQITDISNIFSIFSSVASLDLSHFNTSKVTNMSGMFDECYSLESLNISSFDTSNVTTMWNMFHGCNSLICLNLSHFNTSNVGNMDNMFQSCISLRSLDISSFDFSKIWVYKMRDAFSECYSLTDLKFGHNLKVSINLKDCPLSHESVISVIDGLAVVYRQRALTLNRNSYNALSEKEIKKAIDKNWKIIDDDLSYEDLSSLSYESLHRIIPSLVAENPKLYLKVDFIISDQLTIEDKQIIKNNGFIKIVRA